MKMIYKTACVLGSLFMANTLFAEIAVVVHPNNPATAASINDIKRVFLGKATEVRGVAVKPVEQSSGAVRDAFLKSVIQKTPSQYNAYWSKMVFSGKGAPSESVADNAAAKKWVAQNKGAIGYIDKATVDGSVKVILSVP